MKTTSGTLLGLLVLGIMTGCAAEKPRVEAVSTTSAAMTKAEEPASATSAEQWAEAKVAKESAKGAEAKKVTEGLDPLSEGASLEAASIPKIERTDKKQVRAKTRGELDAALSVVKTAASVEEAATKLTARLGKVSWTENGSKRVWVATPRMTNV